MTFTPTSLLAVNSQYYFLMTNAIKDATGNTFPQYGYVSLYTQYTANTTPVTVVAANPPANTTVAGTNVTVQLQFSADMNQSTDTGLTVMQGANPVAGTYSWNASPTCNCGPGTILSFTPTTALTPNTTYTVAYGAPLADTAGNAVTPGSFTFTTGSGADSTQNYSGGDFTNGLTNAGTNFAPRMNYAKPVNPIDINTGTLLLYNADSGKYVAGTVTVAPNGLSAVFTPTYPLLPGTYYRFDQSGGYCDMDGVYLNGTNWYFTTGAGSDLTPPTVASISPANNATAVPLNSEVVVHFSSPIDPETVANAVQVTPSGGSAIAGTASLASDMVIPLNTEVIVAVSSDVDPTSVTQSSVQLLNGSTPVAGTVTLPNAQELVFTPSSALSASTLYTVNVSGFTDANGNAMVPSSTTFTTGGTTSTPGLSIISSNIPNGSSNVSATSPIILTFSQILDPATVTAATLPSFDGWNSNRPIAGTYAVNGAQVTFTPTNPYPVGRRSGLARATGPRTFWAMC